MIIIRTPKSQEEYKRACSLIEAVYKEHGYVDYLQSNPSTLFLAVENHRIIGAVGLFLANGDKLPTEDIFGFDLEKEFPKASRKKVAEISRLAAIEHHAMASIKGLFVILYLYAKKCNVQFTVASVKSPLLRFLTGRIGLPVHIIDKKVKSEKVPDCYQGYFLENPAPVPIVIITKESAPCLEKVKKELEGIVGFEMNGSGKFDHRIIFKDLPVGKTHITR